MTIRCGVIHNILFAPAQAEYQALLVRKGMQPMKQQVSQNPPNAGGGGISGGPQLSAVRARFHFKPDIVHGRGTELVPSSR